MKKLFLLMILLIILMLRFSLSVRVTEVFQKEVYRMNLSLEDGRIKVLKINNKYPLKNIYGKLGYKENGKYEGYFLVKFIKEYENIYFVELEDVKSTRIEGISFGIQGFFMKTSFLISIVILPIILVMGNDVSVISAIASRVSKVEKAGIYLASLSSVFFFIISFIFYYKYSDSKKAIIKK